MRLLAKGMAPYEVTDVDRLWLLRAVQVEGPPCVLVARTLVNGFCWARAKRRYARDLCEWVRAYAQPVNDRWYVSGDLHIAHCARLKSDADRAVCVRAAMEREARHSKRVEFAPHVESAVDTALSTDWQDDTTDYAAPGVDALHKGYVPRSEPKRGENRFWTRCVGWGGYAVERIDDHV